MGRRLIGLVFLLLLSNVTFAASQNDKKVPPVLGGDVEEVVEANTAVPNLGLPEISSMPEVDSYGPTLEDRVADLERYARENTNYLIDIDKRLTAVERTIAKLTIKTTDGKTTTQSVSVASTNASQPFDLPPGAVITHIDGVPVHRSTFYNSTIQAPVQTYSTPAYQISAPRVYRTPRVSAPRMFIRPMIFGTCANGRCG